MASPLHALVDRVAIRVEDLRRRPAVGFRPRAPAPLDCFGPLPATDAVPTPPAAGRWRFASPRPVGADATASVVVRPAHGARRGTAVLVPPWKIRSLALVAPWARLAARAGLEVWTLVPPRHLDRAAGHDRSGDALVSPDLPALAAALEQLVLEVRLLLAVARARGGEVALVGLSLGALGAALAATAPEAADAAALVAPPVDLASVLASTGLGRRYAALAARAGAPLPADSALAAMLAAFAPGARPPTARRVLVAAGREDRIAPAEDAVALARVWSVEPRLYDRGHLTLLFGCGAVRRDVARLLAPA